MNNDNYDQVQVPEDIIGKRRAVSAREHDGEAVASRPGPRWRSRCRSARRLKLVDTEPVTKGQTASSSYKPAILVQRRAPPRCRRMSEPETRIVVMTEDGFLRRARPRTRQRSTPVAAGDDAIEQEKLPACSRVVWQPCVCFPPLRRQLPADEFRTPSISAVRVEWRAVLDQLRSEINRPARDRLQLHVREPAAGACHRSAFDNRHWCN